MMFLLNKISAYLSLGYLFVCLFDRIPRIGAGEIVKFGKCLHYKHKDLSSRPSILDKKT